MNGYEKRTKAKKESIINAARELFTERGITDVGISEIAAKAGVSQVSIYNYFGDKNSLAKEVLISYLDQSIQEYEEILKGDIPFSEKLKIIMDKKHDAVIEVSRSNFSKYAWEDKTLQQVYKEAATIKATSIYTKFIELGKKEGAIDESIPNDAILSFLFSSVSIMQQSDYLKTSLEYKMGILRLFLYGLLGKEE
ncbi:AcrR family transcriptional regulator [Anaerosolibacter carboniphilus]|uniref:AcrR family transcriptional regulator n=2 Tax=Anaerosolibacter carboniphilus TaxID=1417629 RepID=A0A841KLH9_9FIRM|nr:AcrR family transcriptional regulator [Anaerosolibacter carboniphilus]